MLDVYKTIDGIIFIPEEYTIYENEAIGQDVWRISLDRKIDKSAIDTEPRQTRARAAELLSETRLRVLGQKSLISLARKPTDVRVTLSRLT